MTKIILRIDDILLERLDKLVQGSNQSRNAYLLDLIKKHLGEKIRATGWVNIILDEDYCVDLPWKCPVCSEDIESRSAWFALLSNGLLSETPCCYQCAFGLMPVEQGDNDGEER